MNPVILDITIINNFNSIWLQISEDVKNTLDTLNADISQLCDTIVGTINEIQVLQGDLGKLNDSFATIGKTVNDLNDYSPKDNLQTTYHASSPGYSYPLINQPMLFDPGDIFGKQIEKSGEKNEKWLETINTNLAHLNSGIEIFKMFGKEFTGAPLKLTQFLARSGATLDILSMLGELGIGETLMGVGAAIDPLLLIPLAGSIISDKFKKMAIAERAEIRENEANKKVQDIIKYQRENSMGEYIEKSIETNRQTLKMPKSEIGAYKIKDLHIPSVPHPAPPPDLTHFTRPEYQIPADKSSVYEQTTPYFIKEQVTQAAKKTDYMLEVSGKVGYDKEIKKYADRFWNMGKYSFLFTSDYNDTIIEDRNKNVKYANKSKKPTLLNRSSNSFSHASSRASVVINFTKPMIENFSIHVNDTKEGMKDFKIKVEEALLEIIKSVNAQN